MSLNHENETLAESAARQIEALDLHPERPLILCDADEVIFAFVAALEDYLTSQGLTLTLRSFALTGNITENASGRVLEHDEVRGHLAGFYDARAHAIDAVPGVQEAMGRLSAAASVVVLTNLALEHRPGREQALRRIGLELPVIANSGLKGPAARALADKVAAPVFFIDDIPHNHASVAVHAPAVTRLHFIADSRLAAMIGKADTADARIDDWPAATDWILRRIDEWRPQPAAAD